METSGFLQDRDSEERQEDVSTLLTMTDTETQPWATSDQDLKPGPALDQDVKSKYISEQSVFYVKKNPTSDSETKGTVKGGFGFKSTAMYTSAITLSICDHEVILQS